MCHLFVKPLDEVVGQFGVREEQVLELLVRQVCQNMNRLIPILIVIIYSEILGSTNEWQRVAIDDDCFPVLLAFRRLQKRDTGNHKTGSCYSQEKSCY